MDLITTHKMGSEENRCVGAYVLNRRTGAGRDLVARCVVMATGGASKVYLYTSNPDVATGDGIAMAWRAGCRVANMEFMQFHPTCLYHPKAKSFLITEALRGEGARCCCPTASASCPASTSAPSWPRGHRRPGHRPRDETPGRECLYLDISHRPPDFVESHFPTIHARCLEFGIDITREPIPWCPPPITPAAVSGGHAGAHRPARPVRHRRGRLHGLHGANRMASNSLLECLVYSDLAARTSKRLSADASGRTRCRPGTRAGSPSPTRRWWSPTTGTSCAASCGTTWASCAPTSACNGPNAACDLLRHEIIEYYSNFRVSNDLLELRNLVDVADLIIQSAQRRRESRGLHYTLDFPYKDASQRAPTVLIPDTYQPRSGA